MDSGVERIAAAFDAAREEHRAALMPYLVAGYPDRDRSLEIARAYVKGGADLVEVGVPFSDPLADGPVIHQAATEALAGGATLETALRVVAEVGSGVPSILMCYVNMILARGPERFADEARDAGAAGVIVPDLPHGEAPEIEHAIRDRGMAPVPLVAPTTTPERLAEICARAEGFVYVVSTVGTTGERSGQAPGIAELCHLVREQATTPIAVGFGVGDVESAAAAGAVSDGVIIGSRLVRFIADSNTDTTTAVPAIIDFLSSIRNGLIREPSSA